MLTLEFKSKVQNSTVFKLRASRPIATVFIFLLMCCAVGSLVGCSTTSKVTEVPVEIEVPTFDFSAPKLFPVPIAVPSEAEIFTLSEQQKIDFSRFLNRAVNSQSPRHIKVFDYLERVT